MNYGKVKYAIKKVEAMPLYAVELTNNHMFKVGIFKDDSYRIFYFTDEAIEKASITQIMSFLLNKYSNAKKVVSLSDFEKTTVKRLEEILGKKYISDLMNFSLNELRNHLDEWVEIGAEEDSFKEFDSANDLEWTN